MSDEDKPQKEMDGTHLRTHMDRYDELIKAADDAAKAKEQEKGGMSSPVVSAVLLKLVETFF